MTTRVLYLPTYWYLSEPVFLSIARCAGDRFYNICLNTASPALPGYDKAKLERFRKCFDEYHELTNTLVWRLPNARRRFEWAVTLLKIMTVFKPELAKQLNAINPDVIVTTSDLGDKVNRMVHAWAEQRRVPFVVIQPSFISLDRRKHTLKQGMSYLVFNRILKLPLLSRQTVFGNENQRDHLFLWGEYFRDCYTNLGIEKHIYLTGNPAFDPIFGGEAGCGSVGLDLPQGRPIITICTQPLEKLIDEPGLSRVNDFYRFAITDNPDLFFVIKLHPRNDIGRYRKAFAGLAGTNFIVVEDADLHSLFRISSVQASVNSFTSFEAVVFGVPVVLVSREGLAGQPDLFSNEIELRASTPGEFSQHLRTCLTEEYRREFEVKRIDYLQPRLGFLDGRSGERVVQKIEEIVGR